MFEFDVYEKDEEYEAVRSTGFFCWQALLVGMIKVPFSSVIYPFIKGHKPLALIAFILELVAILVFVFAGATAKPVAVLLFAVSVFGISIGYYAIQRAIAKKYFGTFVGKYHGATEEQAVSEALKKLQAV